MKRKQKKQRGLTSSRSRRFNGSHGWQEFFDLADAARVPDDFLAARDDEPPQVRRLFCAASQEEQVRWVAENRTAIDEKIRRGIEEFDRGQGIPEAELDSYLTRLKLCAK